MKNSVRVPIKMKRRRFNFDEFDSLPRSLRDAINYAAFKYTANRAATASMVQEMDAKQVAAAYSQRDALDELKELGL
jgi:hypothetical protein